MNKAFFSFPKRKKGRKQSARQKGRAKELKAKKTLEAEGWSVIIAPTPQIWQKKVNGGTDFFGLFDLIAVKEGKIRFIQVKLSKENEDHTGVQWKQDAKQYSLITASCAEIWIYIPRKREPRIKEL